MKNMQLHENIRKILEKSDIIKKYDAIGIITIIMIIGWIIDAGMILRWCQSSKGVALIIKNGGPLVKLFVRRNLYKKMIAAGVNDEDARVLSENIVNLIRSMSVEEITDLLEMINAEPS